MSRKEFLKVLEKTNWECPKCGIHYIIGYIDESDEDEKVYHQIVREAKSAKDLKESTIYYSDDRIEYYPASEAFDEIKDYPCDCWKEVERLLRALESEKE